MDVKIEKLVYGGDGLGHADGATVFVPYVLPEEVVRVRELERKKKFVRGRVEEVVTASAERTSPPCRHFGVCGGCHYQHMPYEVQLRYKAEILRENVRRIGRVNWERPIETVGSPPLGYRNRAQWHIRSEGTGYLQAGTSVLCAVEECPILSPRLAKILERVRELAAQKRLPPTVTEIEAFADAADEKVLLSASLSHFHGQEKAVAETLRGGIEGTESVLLHEASRGVMELNGPGFLTYEVGGVRYRVGHLSFFQVNRFLIEEMVQRVVGEERGGLAVDLYAGVGLFTLPLARRYERAIGVEANPATVRDLRANAKENKVECGAVNEGVEKFLSTWKDAPDLVVLDPPRAGVPGPAIEKLRRLAPARIVYLSCDPSTLARDLAALLATDGPGASYEMQSVELLDVFPQTYHIEALVRLTRRE